MTLHFILVQNRQGKTRLSKWYDPYTVSISSSVGLKLRTAAHDFYRTKKRTRQRVIFTVWSHLEIRNTNRTLQSTWTTKSYTAGTQVSFSVCASTRRIMSWHTWKLYTCLSKYSTPISVTSANWISSSTFGRSIVQWETSTLVAHIHRSTLFSMKFS